MDAKARRRLLSKPLVVLDWGWIQARGRYDYYLPNAFNYGIPDVVLDEILGKHSPVGYVVKLLHILAKNPCKFYLGKHWNHIADLETAPGVLVSRADIIQEAVPPLSADPARTTEWAATVKEMAGAPTEQQRVKAAFERHRIEVNAALSETADERGEKIEGTTKGVIGQYVRAPDTAAQWACRDSEERDNPEWRAALGVFPDRHALGRFFRIWVWMCLRPIHVTTKKEDRIRNDAEDSAYLLLASYADQFWTCDYDSAEAAKLLFPSLTVMYAPPGNPLQELKAEDLVGFEVEAAIA